MNKEQLKQLKNASKWIIKAMSEENRSKEGLLLIYADDCINAVLENRKPIIE